MICIYTFELHLPSGDFVVQNPSSDRVIVDTAKEKRKKKVPLQMIGRSPLILFVSIGIVKKNSFPRPFNAQHPNPDYSPK